MTMDVAMGLGPAIPARGGERGGRTEKGETSAFDDALTRKPAGRMPPPRDDAEQAEGQPPKWRLGGGYGDKLALLMPFGPSPDPAAGDPAEMQLQDPDAALPDTAAHDDASDAVDAPDTTPRMQADGDPARTGTAIAPRQDQRQPAGQDEAAQAAGAIDTDGEDAPRRQAHAGGTGTASGTERAQAAAPVAAAIGEPAPAERRAAQARDAERRPGAQASLTADEAARQEQRPAPADRQQPELSRLTATRATAERGGTDTRAQTGAENGQPRVNVLGFSTSAPPVLPAALSQPSALSPTAAGVVAAMEAEPTWRAAAAEAATQRGQHAGTVSTLRIQLNPAELGLVTARLVATGSQLEIEIRVESNDARQRLSNDADSIVKALRGIGYDIERVTIQQAQPGGTASQQQGGGQRDPFMQGQQGEGEANAGRGGQGEKSDGNAARSTPGETAAERAGGGVYI